MDVKLIEMDDCSLPQAKINFGILTLAWQQRQNSSRKMS